ncbi:hypothetical protein JHD50_02885 [Sulfurimonas sp. MAG313]|nr:hypothetical protein [Sulfurimonas sp. MAG313]MDF1880257.1 hypothetical protein [Sulfurimonas sp. MAG313]
MKSNFNLDITQIIYTYSFHHTKKVELGVSAGLHITAVDFALSPILEGTSTDIKFKLAPPLPVIGGRLNYHITPK